MPSPFPFHSAAQNPGPADGRIPAAAHPTGELVAAVRGGDRASWHLVDERYRKRLAFLVRGRIPVALRRRFDTEDVVQSTILAAYSELGTFRDQGTGSFQRWISAILRNRLSSRIRFHRSRLRDPAEEVDSGDGSDPLKGTPEFRSFESDVELADSIARVVDTLADMPETTNEVIRRRFFDGQTFDQMATDLGISECAARRRLSAAIVDLRRRL